jgi:plastocyanin
MIFIAAIMIAILASCSKEEEDDQPGIVNVNMDQSSFLPAQITITAGTTVKWDNGSSIRHTVTREGLFDEVLEPGESFSHTFNNTGSFPYACTLHPGMEGLVTVQ